MSLLDKASLVITPNATKESKLYSVIPSDGSGDMTVVRATTATRVNSNGLIESVASNVPRIDYTDSTCPSILIEGQRTNLVTYSEQFDNASWNKSNSTINANSIISPDGTQNASKLVEDTANSSHYFRSDFTIVTSGSSYTYSIFAKKAERNFILLFDSYINSGYWFNLDTGIVGSKYGTGAVTAKIENYVNGWYRCSITFTAHSGGYALLFNNVTNADNVNAYTGDGISGLFIWGAQLEQGSYPTSYIPTVASAVTRNADVISKTGISDLIGQTEGVIYGEFTTSSFLAIDQYFFMVSDGTTTNTIYLGFYSNILIARIIDSSNLVCNINVSLATNTTYKIAFAYKANDCKLYINGVDSGTDTSATIPNTTKFGMNEGDSTGSYKVAKSLLFKTRLTNEELATLTTL